MAQISAAAVKEMREKTGLPMMDCKKALVEAEGDMEQAIDLLRKAGKKTMEKRSGRATESGKIAMFTDPKTQTSAMVELLCESAPVASTKEFNQLASDLAEQLAKGPGATTAEELLAQPSPSGEGTLQQQFDDLVNKIREVFKVNRLIRVEGTTGGYVHHTGQAGVLLIVEGNDIDLARDICMHVAAMRPKSVSKEELDQELVARERAVLMEAARQEGKPENIIEKMVEGRMKNFYAESCLLDQTYVKDSSKTVSQAAEEGGLKIKQMIHWELGVE
jgi:elongation factor Ts